MFTRELPTIMEKAMSGIQRTPKGYHFSEESRQLISEMAAYAVSTPTYGLLKPQAELFRERNRNASAADIYLYLLERIVSSPSAVMRQYVILLVAPWLDERLKIEGADSMLQKIQITSIPDLAKFLNACDDKVLVTIELETTNEGSGKDESEPGAGTDK